MSRFPLQIAAAMLGLAAFAAPAPASAQTQADSSDKVDLVIVYGKDACPPSRDDEIIVCARKPESERYRIPEGLREHPSPDNQAWTNRVTSYERVGAAGTQSCSATGAGGWTGCFHNFISQAYAEKKAEQDTHFSEMVAAARAQREATIDAKAAQQQAQVEATEKAQAASQAATANPAPDTGK